MGAMTCVSDHAKETWGHAYPTLLGDLFNPIGALVRPKTCHFVGKNGPIDNLSGARFFKILGSVSVSPNRMRQTMRRYTESIKRHAQTGVTPCRDCVSLQGTGEEAAWKR